MAYVDTIRELEQNGYNPFQAACMVSIEDLFEDKTQMIPWLRLYNTLAFALLCREREDIPDAVFTKSHRDVEY